MNTNYKKVRDTFHDLTNLGPILQKLSLPMASNFAFNLSATSGTGNLALDPGTILQAAFSGVALNLTAGNNTQSFTLNKAVNPVTNVVAPNGSVAKMLQDTLGLDTVGDTAILKFYWFGDTLDGGTGIISVTSNDTSVTGSPAVLFSGAVANTLPQGFVTLGVRATSVTPGAETVALLAL